MDRQKNVIRLALVVSFAALLSGPSPALASSFLGSAESFAVLAGGAVTCTNAAVTGDVGAGTVITQTSCTISGAVHQGDAVAQQAYADFLGAYATLASRPCDQTLTGTLAGVVLTPGVYCFDAAATLTGTLTLKGPVNGVWLFKVGTLGTGALTGTNFSVVMAGGGQACNVTWWTAEAATMTDSNLAGTILAGAAVTETRGTQSGSAFAKAGATVTGTAIVGCASEAGPGPGPGPGAGSCPDRVTGGGYIKVGRGSANFGVTAGIRNGAPRGHLTYIDHTSGMKVKGTGVTAYVDIDSRTRRIGGTAKVNGQSGFTYEVDVTDNGEHGKNDSFAIRISDASGFSYTASGKLAGGNIQLHKRHCDRNGHDRDDDEDYRGDDHNGDEYDEHGDDGN